MQYPDSFEHTTIIVSAEAKSNANIYFYEKDIRDLLYTGLDPKLFQAFLSQKKYLKNGNGTLCSYSHLSKFYMAVKWGSTTASGHLPLSFYSEMDAYLVAFKKEHAAAKKEGKTDGREEKVEADRGVNMAILDKRFDAFEASKDYGTI
jgi:hypothetical protein